MHATAEDLRFRLSMNRFPMSMNNLENTCRSSLGGTVPRPTAARQVTSVQKYLCQCVWLPLLP